MSWSGAPDMAETTTATSLPASISRLTWWATLRMRSRSATEVPPNFITRRAIGVDGSVLSNYGLKLRAGPSVIRCKMAGPHVVTGPAPKRAYTYRRGARAATRLSKTPKRPTKKLSGPSQTRRFGSAHTKADKRPATHPAHDTAHQI